jgi:hypothetical protein
MHQMWGVMAVVPCAMLVTVSFFVLFAREKTENASLKSFGLVAAGFLWAAAAMLLVAGIVSLACCRPCGMDKGFHRMAGFGQGACDMKTMPCAPGPGHEAGPSSQPLTSDPAVAPAGKESKRK